MNKYNKIYGVDISKDVFDSFSSCGDHHLHDKDPQGFSKFSKKLNPNDLIIMESTVIITSG